AHYQIQASRTALPYQEDPMAYFPELLDLGRQSAKRLLAQLLDPPVAKTLRREQVRDSLLLPSPDIVQDRGVVLVSCFGGASSTDEVIGYALHGRAYDMEGLARR